MFTSKKYRRQLTGLILNNDGNPSMGRDKKRLIRSMAYRFYKNELTQEQSSHLKGLIAFAISIEPLFVKSIHKMIGEEAYLHLMKG